MLNIRLFGKLDIQNGDDEFEGVCSLKSRELFAYLLLNRDRSHAREKVASLLWGGHCTTSQSRKYLRNALWQLQSALNGQTALEASGFLHVESDWIQLNSVPMLQLDVHVFEAAYASVEGVSGTALDDDGARKLDQALHLYRGDLLESWYQDWFLYDRERMLQIYLIMLDKMMGYSEAHRQFEKGLSYGRRILRHDRARECTHRRLMRLHYLRGDRSSALRQYTRCAAALEEELDVAPSRRTAALYEQLRDDRWQEADQQERGTTERQESEMENVLRSLRGLRASLAEVRQRVRWTEEAVGEVMQKREKE